MNEAQREAVANADLLRRWEQLTDVVGRQAINGQQQPITPVDPTLASFDPLVQQLHRHSDQGPAIEPDATRMEAAVR